MAKPKQPQPNETLARYLFAASVAYDLGIGLTYAYKTYVRNDIKMGQFWLQLAELVETADRVFVERLYRKLHNKPEPLTDQIQ